MTDVALLLLIFSLSMAIPALIVATVTLLFLWGCRWLTTKLNNMLAKRSTIVLEARPIDGTGVTSAVQQARLVDPTETGGLVDATQ